MFTKRFLSFKKRSIKNNIISILDFHSVNNFKEGAGIESCFLTRYPLSMLEMNRLYRGAAFRVQTKIVPCLRYDVDHNNPNNTYHPYLVKSDKLD